MNKTATLEDRHSNSFAKKIIVRSTADAQEPSIIHRIPIGSWHHVPWSDLSDTVPIQDTVTVPMYRASYSTTL